MTTAAATTAAKIPPAIRRAQSAQPRVEPGTVMPLAAGYGVLRQIKKRSR